MFKLDRQIEDYISILPEDKASKLIAAHKADPLQFFCPNGAQERYIEAVAKSTKGSKIPVVLCTFANGVGKTEATLHIILNLIFGPQNGWFDYPIFKMFTFPKLIWYISSPTALKDTVQPRLEELLKSDLIKDRQYYKHKEGKHIISKIVFANGWRLMFKTYNQDPSEFESANVGVIVKDEPAPETIWKAVKSRRRKGCLTLMPMTPLDCPPYIFDEIKKNADKGMKGYYHVEGDIYEACKIRGVRGHLDPEIIDEMVKSYDPEEVQARAYGKPMYFSQMIYPGLMDGVHFVNPKDFPIPIHSQILHIVDPHESRPSASIWAAKTPTGRYIIFDEYPTDKSKYYWEMKKGLDTDEEVQRWIEIEERQIRESLYAEDSNVTRILDRHFGWQKRGGRTFAESYYDSGVKFKHDFTFLSSYSSPFLEGEIQYGHMAVRKLLKIQDDGYPGLVIWRNCFHTWAGLTHYIRRKMTGKTADDHAASDGIIVEKYKDFPDVVRYLACENLVLTGVPKEEETYTDKVLEEVKYGSRDYSEFSI